MNNSTNVKTNGANSTAVDALRAGAIGVVSGIKGGAVSGALAGILLAVSMSLSAGEWAAVVFAVLAGATYGGMGTAVVGAVMGAFTGTLSGWILLRQNDTSRVPYLWWGIGLLLGLLGGWYFVVPIAPLAIVLGGLCGLLAGWLGARDFLHLITMQYESDETDAEIITE